VASNVGVKAEKLTINNIKLKINSEVTF